MTDRRSRHRTLPTYTTRVGGREVELLVPRECQRVLPAGQATVEAGDRLDLLADALLSDPQGFWRFGEINPCRRAEDLLDPGRTLIVPERRDG